MLSDVKPLEQPKITSFRFDESPFIVIWEMTRSCALKCVHCRAEAIDRRDAGELNTHEAYALLREVRRFGTPLVVLTGGDPMRRPDAGQIVRFGTNLGLRMAMTPSGTAEMSFEKVKDLKDNGLARLAVSLDGSTAGVHDLFRRVEGSYHWTMDIVRWANENGLPVQINTTISKHNISDIDGLCRLMESLDIVLWSVFFLVPVGRGRLEDEIRGSDYERIFHKMYDLSRRCAFDIKSTEAPHYRRVIVQRRKKANQMIGDFASPGFYAHGGPDPVGRASQGVNDGNGFVFISHTGEIFPSGFLPLTAGNVKKDSLVEVYRDSDLFRTIRDKSKLKGKCGACEYKSICGGSRSRAWAVHGDYLGADPFCVYVPKNYTVTEKERAFW